MIFRRELTVSKDGKPLNRIVVELGPFVHDGESVACDFTLPEILPEPRKSLKSWGEDELHALGLCLKAIKTIIADYEENTGCVIYWLEDGDHGGFDWVIDSV